MSNKLIEIKDKLNRSLHDLANPWTRVLEKAEKKVGLDRLYIFLGSIAIICLWLVFGYCAQLVCNIVGFLYPAYVSIHAIESKSKDDDTKWLTYWVCLCMIWLMIPTEFNGSLILYTKVIKPYFLKHHQTIDEKLNKVKESANKLLEKSE
ncbi:hypothetical protein NQ317_000207 [Molorchus minor]|uniref:Receptor expression-enhancing protein n=1 Tax=Molorchus minor TaxID=1323400 RepID=A0ABQ9JBD1_9CUCU|nr:hypothetical protein NQ317_000207 [Molorchus minor]